MTRRPIFWLVFSALGLAGAVVAVTLFSTALPSISVDIAMDRGAAIDSAGNMATRFSWGAPDDRSAATFGLADDLVHTYVELEGGGPEVIERLAERNVYEAYQWRVRRFAEGRVEESWARFTPEGEPYGFRLILPEDDAGGGNSSAAEARGLAESEASVWGVDLGSYRLIESSAESLPTGRVDHTFVYERTDERLGEAGFRLRVVISGARASELTHFVSVPEAFSRRYGDMRSTNDSIALVAQAVLLALFVLLGAGVGSALLLRSRWLEWRAPLAWGGLIAVLFGAAAANRLPLSWTSYDTALSATGFALQQLSGGIAVALIGTPLIAFFLMAGESLGRKAFPRHLQQWRFWSPEVASSTTAFGMTAAAYLMVGLQVGYVVLFYLGTQRLEGWWSPADALVQPDLLATYFPWLEAVSLALFAAFWEESLFRAVPIACAALLGARYGKKGAWIWGTVLLQAVVFAAGHANYPQQPPYARVIELTAPALLWGGVYVFFGLVPTILAHFLYDLSLISIVLFESRALLDQAVIGAVGLLPLGMVVAARWRRGARALPPDWAYNAAWTPPVRSAEATSSEETTARESTEWPAGSPEEGGSPRAPRPGPSPLPRWGAGAALALGIVAIVVWAARTTPPLPLWGDRQAAVGAATADLEARGVRLDEWEVFVTAGIGGTEGREYVYEEAGLESFTTLEGDHFGVPSWLVRLVDWGAEPAERVEEYQAWVGPGGEVRRVRHILPEARPGESLDVETARALALGAIEEFRGLGVGALRQVEAQELSRPDRTDWLFTFAEIGLLTDVEGEVRHQVRIAGAEVVDVAPTIHVPEEWQRDRRRVESRTRILVGGLTLLLVLMFGAAAVTAVVVWSRRMLPVGVMTRLAVVSFAALVASSANDWPLTTAAFGTGQPWSFQANATLIGVVLFACVAAPAVGLVGALGHAWVGPRERRGSGFGAAVAYGLLFGGLSLSASALASGPETGSYLGAASAVPVLAPALNAALVFLILTSGVLALVGFRQRFRHSPFMAGTLWSLVLAAGVVLVPAELQTSTLLWGAVAVLAASVLAAGLLLCSAEPVLVPGIVAVVLAARGLGVTWWEPYAGARAGGIIAALVLAGLALAWTRQLADSGSPRPPAGQSLGETRASVGNE